MNHHQPTRAIRQPSVAWLGASLFLLSACTPPSLRSAHSLDAGAVAVDLAGGLNTTTVNAEVLTTTDDVSIASGPEFKDQLTGDVVLRVGLGHGFELGASLFAAHAKYSALDERRHPNAPLSIGLTGQVGMRYAGAGALFSKQIGDGKLKVRPVLNVWYQQHRMPLTWALPENALESADEVVNPGISGDENEGELGPGLYAHIVVQEVAIPLGVEIPINVNDEYDVVPFVAYALSIPTAVAYSELQCVDCFAGLEGFELQRRSTLWMGFKIQPPLTRTATTGE